MNAEPSGLHRVLSDIADLAQLQLKLLAVDGREAGRRGIGALLLLGTAGCLLIAAATVALIGFGWVLHEVAGWQVGWSLLAMAALACLLTVAVLGLAYLSIKKAAAALQETGAEFAENLAWLRAAMGPPRNPSGPRPAGPPPHTAYPYGPYAADPYAADPYAAEPPPGTYAGDPPVGPYAAAPPASAAPQEWPAPGERIVSRH